MRPDFEQLKKDISYEQKQIDVVIAKITETKENVSELNVAAVATYLMNFYNGIENIMKRCAKEYYKKMPRDVDWHKQLLQQSYLSNKGKLPLFDKDTADKLYNYLTFRHIFIHGYSFNLKWDKIKNLVDDVEPFWKEIKGQIAAFIDRI